MTDLNGVPVVAGAWWRNVARAPRSVGENAAGSWIQTAWLRGPRGSIAVRKVRSSPSTFVSRRSWVISCGSFTTNRKSGGVCAAHEATVDRDGVA
jgi:hypothetical protein